MAVAQTTHRYSHYEKPVDLQVFMAAAVFALFGTTLLIITMCSEAWSLILYAHKTQFNGPFQWCYYSYTKSGSHGIYCHHRDDPSGRYLICEILLVIAAICACLGVLLGIIYIFLKKMGNRRTHSLMAPLTGVFVLVAGILTVLTIILWATLIHEIKDDNFVYGWAFVVAIIAGIILLFAAILFFLKAGVGGIKVNVRVQPAA